jgi:hypothetical protein
MGVGNDFVRIFRDPKRPGARSAADRIFCGPGLDRIEWRGAVDRNDVIDETCEDIDVGRLSREDVDSFRRAAHG